MTELILCLVAVCMVAWIILLMSENAHLKREVAELKRTVREKLNATTGGIEVRDGRRLTASEIDRVNRTPQR